MLLAVKKIDQFLKKKNKARSWLAERASITPNYLSMLISGARSNASDSVKLRIQDATKGFVKFADWGKRV